MNGKTRPATKTFSFGGCDIENTSPTLAALTSKTSILNVRVSFEESLKLHLAIGECIRKLNTYKRNTKAGRRTGVNLAIHLQKNRFTVNEENMD